VLAKEEARVRKERQELLREIDRHDFMLKRLRYDRVDYLVQRQEQMQQEQNQDGRRASFTSSSGSDAAAPWEREAAKRVLVQIARLGVGTAVVALASAAASSPWPKNFWPTAQTGVLFAAKASAVIVSAPRPLQGLVLLVSGVCALKVVSRRLFGGQDPVPVPPIVRPGQAPPSH
jgi:uncharacterized membrane protein YcjF (UPF0283 family)